MMQAEREDWGVAELYASALVERGGNDAGRTRGLGCRRALCLGLS